MNDQQVPWARVARGRFRNPLRLRRRADAQKCIPDTLVVSQDSRQHYCTVLALEPATCESVVLAICRAQMRSDPIDPPVLEVTGLALRREGIWLQARYTTNDIEVAIQILRAVVAQSPLDSSKRVRLSGHVPRLVPPRRVLAPTPIASFTQARARGELSILWYQTDDAMAPFLASTPGGMAHVNRDGVRDRGKIVSDMCRHMPVCH